MSLEITHRVRARPDAIVVGVGTVLVDNPRLTARTETVRPQPKRGVLDRELRTPVDAALFDAPGGEICIVISDHACPDRADALERAGASV
jgi:riboflavin biosynthesis pyrimidine reductase